MAIRAGLLDEIVRMAFDTVRTNKMRSGLTILGIVIGITALVGMTAVIKGFDESMRDMFRELGPKTLFVQKFGAVSMTQGKAFADLIKRPTLSVADAKAIERESETLDRVDVWIGAWGIATQERIFYRNKRTKPLVVFGATQNFAAVNFVKLDMGRFFNDGEVQRRRQVVVLGRTAFESLFDNIDPLEKVVRIGSDEYTVVGVLGKRPSPGGFNVGADDFVVVPYTTHQKFYGQVGNDRLRFRGVATNASAMRSAMIAVVPRENATRDEAIAEVRSIMRARHNLRLDQEDDFDIVTQEAGMKIWDKFSQAIFLALVVISSIALMVGGIGVTAIMTISVTERTREIGLRKALGARRQEVLWQFLFEAVFLTCVGGLIGILLGSAIGVAVHYFTGFPVFLPWWSFALGFAFSAIVGIFFGMYPALRASRLDPIEALRYE
ncbi:MAG: ABC transporter permease [Acidobacteria bacterium]|nr:ABC transporter permease [Acidobacteriota bacterium]